MRVRKAELGDMKRMGEIMARSFRAAFADFVSPETMEACAREDSCAELLEGIFREGNMRFLIGDNSGMLVWRHDGDKAEIMALHSLPESVGSGLGEALLTEAMEEIGGRPVCLWVFRDNLRARRFYEKQGFRHDGTERVSEFDGAVELRYVKGY